VAGVAVVLGTVRVGPPGDPAVAAAVGWLRAIHSAQQAFASSCGGGAFAASLDDLRRPPRGASNGFISEGVGTSGFGYKVTLEPRPAAERLVRTSCSGVSLVAGYVAHADPPGDGANPSLAMREDGAIFMRRDGRPMAADFEGAERLR
jgi:hypothetical protein